MLYFVSFLVCFIFIVFLVSRGCYCPLPLPKRGAVVWATVCNFGFPGHTRFLVSLCDSAGRSELTLLENVIGNKIIHVHAAHIVFYYTTTRVNVFVLVKFALRNALKTQLIRTVISTGIPNSQSKLVIDNALNYNVAHLPVYQSIKLI